MKITVLMSTYNGEKYLVEQIESILSQKDNEIRILVRDDGSSDNSLNILKSYEKNNNVQLLHSENNLGAAGSFMQLVYNSPESDYYAFSDQDDWWYEDKLSRAVNALKNIDKPAIYYSNAEVVDSELNSNNCMVYQKMQKPSLLISLCSCNVLGCTMVMNKQLVDIIKTSPNNNTNIIMHDNYICAICMLCGGRIIYDNKASMKYRQHGGNVVGVQYEKKFLQRLIYKLNWISKTRKVSISEQCAGLLNYKKYMTNKGYKYASMVSRYKKSLFNRIYLSTLLLLYVISGKATKHEILCAMSILLGKA